MNNTVQSPAQPKPMRRPMNTRLIAAVVIVVLLAVVGAVVNNVRNQKGNQNWTVYKNQQAGIQLSYPSSWGQPNFRNKLEYYSVVNLPKFHISAVHIGYYIIGSLANCPNNKFSDTANCISDQIYKDVARVAQSIKII
jgi:hypothetical protein